MPPYIYSLLSEISYVSKYIFTKTCLMKCREFQVFHRTHTTRVEGTLDSISSDISNLAQGTDKLDTSMEEMKEAIASLEREFKLSKPPAVVGPNTDVQPAGPSRFTPTPMEVNESRPQREGDSINDERDGNGDDDNGDNDVRYNNHDCDISEDPDRGKASTDECLSTSLLARDFPIDRRVQRSSSSLYILLGTLEWKSTITTINWKDSPKGGEHSQRPWKVTTRSLRNFRPAPWLTSWICMRQNISEKKSTYGGISSQGSLKRFPCIRSDNDQIFRACKARQLEVVQTLFENKLALPWDMDSSGKGLLEHVIFPDVAEPDTVFSESTFMLAKYLIECGAEPAPSIKAIYKQRAVLRQQGLYNRNTQGNLVGTQYASTGALQNSNTQDLETEESWKRLEELGRMCINQAHEDPFEDPGIRNDVWKTSEIGIAAFPMGSFYLYHEEWPIGVEDLAFENPDSIFFDLVTTEVISTTPRHDLISRLDCRYRTLANLCRNGIKAEIVACYMSQKEMPSSSQIYNCANGHSLFCQDGPTHLLHSLLGRVNMERHRKEHRGVVRQHIRRMLVLLLKHAEDPRLRCCCPRAQAANCSRTPTEIAAAKGVLDIWAKALAEAGIDAEEFHLDDFATAPVDVVQSSQAGPSESQASSASTRLNLSPETRAKLLRKLALLL